MEMLPDELTDRASALFVAALRYTVDMLTWEQCDSLPVGLQPEGELTDHYICMLFNDEVHTYEQVGTRNWLYSCRNIDNYVIEILNL